MAPGDGLLLLALPQEAQRRQEQSQRVALQHGCVGQGHRGEEDALHVDVEGRHGVD